MYPNCNHNSVSFSSMIWRPDCKIVQLCFNGCSNLIWVWRIRICRDISDSSPLVAVICVLKMAANKTSRTLLIIRKPDGWIFMIHFRDWKGIRMLKNMSEKLLKINWISFCDFYAYLRRPSCRNWNIALKSLFHMIEEPIKGLTLGFQGQGN